MIIYFAVQGDEKALIEGGLRLRAMYGIDDPQTARTHRDFVPDRNKWISNISAMQHARDQKPNGRFGAMPIDGYRYTAHLAPEIASCLATELFGQHRLLRLTTGYIVPEPTSLWWLTL